MLEEEKKGEEADVFGIRRFSAFSVLLLKRVTMMAADGPTLGLVTVASNHCFEPRISCIREWAN